MNCVADTFKTEYLKLFPAAICAEDYILAKHSTMRVGGRAAFTVFPTSIEQLIAAVRLCRELGVSHAVLGHLSNVVVADEGYNGVIIKTDNLDKVKADGNLIYAECGASLNSLSKTALNASLEGADFLFGIPGSVGGACYMNTGAYGGEMKDIVVSVTVYDAKRDKVVTLLNSECGFGYRTSIFHGNDDITVLYCTVRLECGDSGEISEKMNAHITARKEKQPLEYPSCGSFFKRVEGYFTAKLIDDCGLKGASVGGAQISEKHAGFLINRDNATARDIKALEVIVKKTVKEKFGVDIEREVEYLG